jgi:hypothetical protein
MADALMIAHFLWAAFMVLGLPLGLASRSARLRRGHFAGMMLTVLFVLLGSYCPLTIWEEELRRTAGAADFSYGGSFLARVLGPILYPDLSPRIINGVSLLWALLTAACLVFFPSRGAGRGKPGAD